MNRNFWLPSINNPVVFCPVYGLDPGWSLPLGGSNAHSGGPERLGGSRSFPYRCYLRTPSDSTHNRRTSRSRFAKG